MAKQTADLERKEWETVSENAQSVLDENVSLLKQQDLLREQVKEMKAQHQAIGKEQWEISFYIYYDFVGDLANFIVIDSVTWKDAKKAHCLGYLIF